MSEITGKPVYGICECKEKVQVLSVDQVVDLIQQMAANDWQVPADYVPKTSVNGIIEQNNKDEIKFWRGTKASYDALTDGERAMYTPIYTDEPKYNEINNRLNQHDTELENINTLLSAIISGNSTIDVKYTLYEGSGVSEIDLTEFELQEGDILEVVIKFNSYNTDWYQFYGREFSPIQIKVGADDVTEMFSEYGKHRYASNAFVGYKAILKYSVNSISFDGAEMEGYGVSDKDSNDNYRIACIGATFDNIPVIKKITLIKRKG